jgi:hypothetical protein
VLAHLGALNEEQARFLADYPPYALPNVPGTLCSAAWESHLRHPELDPTLTTIFALMTPAVVRAKLAALPHHEQRALVGHPIEATASDAVRAAVSTLQDASEILGHPPPVACLKAGPLPYEAGLALVPTIIVSADAVSALTPGMLSFLAGKRLAEHRPALMARALFPSVTELSLILQTAIRIARGGVSADVGDGRNRKSKVLSSSFDDAIRRAMSQDELTRLRRAVEALFRPGAAADLARWSQLSDLTATRAGLLLSGSVEVARRAMSHERQHASDLPPRVRLKELVLFAVSDEYADLRGAIGVSVEATMYQ